MKKSILMLFVLVLIQSANAQTDRLFRPWKIDVSLGYLMSANNGKGIIVATEPKYAFTDNIVSGIRFEGASTGSFSSSGIDAIDYELSSRTVSSYTLTTDYLIGENGLRPFVGGGIGYASLILIEASSASGGAPQELELEYKDGKAVFLVRAGVEYRKLRASFEYNIIGKTEKTIQNNYFGIKVSAFFGGGRF